MKQVHARRHVQTTLSPTQYDRLARAAKRHGLTLQEAIREALVRWVYTEGGEQDPFDALIGKLEAPPGTSSGVDDIYLED